MEGAIILEKDFQNLISNNELVQQNILELIGSDMQSSFFSETVFINGITSDFTISHGGIIQSILECKQGGIGVTEYVRGLGQLLQYNYFFENGILPVKYPELKYNQTIVNYLVLPSSFIFDTTLNIGNFAYPENSGILEINVNNNYVRLIDKKELVTLSEASNSNIASISQYYLRDNRISEYFTLIQLLNVCCSLTMGTKQPIKRIEMEKRMKKTNAINNGNWRNAFITISNFGFIDRNNRLTTSGAIMARKSYEDFVLELYRNYISTYVDTIMDCLVEMSSGSQEYFSASYADLNKMIDKKFNGKKVLYLTESNNRYLSSWLNILRDDFGCIDFKSRSPHRKIIYIPKDSTDSSLKEKIKKSETAQRHISNMVKVIDEEFIK